MYVCVCVKERAREQAHVHEYVWIHLVKRYEGEGRRVTGHRSQKHLRGANVEPESKC